MRTLALALALALAGCGNPIDRCDDPSGDCCQTDAQCLDYFGSTYPFCESLGDGRGTTCAECRSNADCPAPGGDPLWTYCYPADDPELGGLCFVPPG